MRSSQFSSSLHVENVCRSRSKQPLSVSGRRTSPAAMLKISPSWHKISWRCCSTFMGFRPNRVVWIQAYPAKGRVLCTLLTTYLWVNQLLVQALTGSHQICICCFPPAPSASTLRTLDDVPDFGTSSNLVHQSGLLYMFVQSGFPLELPFSRFVPTPQLFFKFQIPHHYGSLWAFTTVRILRRSYRRRG